MIQDQDEGFVAECLSESIVTEADTWQELRANVKEAGINDLTTAEVLGQLHDRVKTSSPQQPDPPAARGGRGAVKAGTPGGARPTH